LSNQLGESSTLTTRTGWSASSAYVRRTWELKPDPRSATDGGATARQTASRNDASCRETACRGGEVVKI
jgi:hypothetical protein